MTTGLTFDTGMLIALERRRRHAEEFVVMARERRIVPVVPADVVVESSGEALAAVRDATATDAVVMASAASRGDVVLTSDVDDLERLRRYFPSVRVLGV